MTEANEPDTRQDLTLFTVLYSATLGQQTIQHLRQIEDKRGYKREITPPVNEENLRKKKKTATESIQIHICNL